MNQKAIAREKPCMPLECVNSTLKITISRTARLIARHGARGAEKEPKGFHRRYSMYVSSLGLDARQQACWILSSPSLALWLLVWFGVLKHAASKLRIGGQRQVDTFDMLELILLIFLLCNAARLGPLYPILCYQI